MTTQHIKTTFTADTAPQDKAVSRSATGVEAMVRQLKAMRRELRTYHAAEMAAKAQRHEEERLNRTLRERSGLVSGMAGRFAAAGVGYMAGRAAVGVLGVASSLEGARLSLASLMRAADASAGGPLASFEKALQASGEAIAMMREEAASTPGALSDVQSAYEAIVVNARRAGASHRDIIKLSSNLATMDVLGARNGSVGRDANQMLMGLGGVNISSPVLRAISGETKKLVEAGKQAEAMQMIIKATELPADERAAHGATFSAQLESMKDRALGLMEVLGKPVLGWLNTEMGKLGVWLDRNKDRVAAIAKVWGDRVLKAVRFVWEAVRDVYTVTASIVGVALDFSNALGGIPAIVAGIAVALNVLKGHPVLMALAGLSAVYGLLKPGEAGGGAATREGGRETAARLIEEAQWTTHPQWTGDKALGAARMRAAKQANLMALLGANDIPAADRAKAITLTRLGLISPELARAAATVRGQELLDAAASGKAGVNIDARGSRIVVQNQLYDTDAERIAGASMSSAFGALVATPITGSLGLGGLVLGGR